MQLRFSLDLILRRPLPNTHNLHVRHHVPRDLPVQPLDGELQRAVQRGDRGDSGHLAEPAMLAEPGDEKDPVRAAR